LQDSTPVAGNIVVSVAANGHITVITYDSSEVETDGNYFIIVGIAAL
jgi:hypothetical protein